MTGLSCESTPAGIKIDPTCLNRFLKIVCRFCDKNL